MYQEKNISKEVIAFDHYSGGELAFYSHSCSFPGPKPVTIGNDLGVTATWILLSSLCSLMTSHQSLFLASFLLSTERSSIFINPEL
jgi:hypothetical protein